MWREIGFITLGAVLVLGIPGHVALGADTFVVGIEESTEDSWQSLSSQFQSSTGITVSVQPLAQNSIPQQVVLQDFTRSGRLNFVMIADSWGSSVSRYLQDLSGIASTFSARGITPISSGGRTVGVPVSFAPGWFLAVLTWPQNQTAAVDFLVATALGSMSAPTTAAATPTAQSVATTYTTGKLSASQHSKKLDGALESLIAAAQSMVSTTGAAGVGSLPSSALAALDTIAAVFGVPFSPQTGMVTVVMEAGPGRTGASNVAALSALGVSGSSVEASSSLVRVTVPVSQLASLVSQLSGVAFVRAPYEPYALSASSQGGAAIQADAYHGMGVTGAGVKVAVIDLGFYGLAQAQAQGDLPATIVQNDLTGTGLSRGISHGTAVAEIIYDIAPGAELTLIKIGDDVDLDQAVTYCLANGIDIVNHSLGWYNTSNYDGNGTIADIARRAVNGGILWVNAAGNDAQSHWRGSFVDANLDGWYDTSVTFTASVGSPIVLYLTWSEWPEASTDYDLYLYDPASNLLASSAKYQTGTEEPTESIRTTAPQSGTYTIRFRGTGSRSLNLYNLYQALSPAVATSSILSPADVAEVLAVGAINYANYTAGPQEPYSSQGPTTDGRAKPDLMCPDNVSTGTGPYTTFAGTSGAAPHAAGAAALLLSLQPSLSASALRAQVLANAVPMGSANVFGQGRLVLQPLSPANHPPVASFSFFPASAIVGQSVSFDASASADSDGVTVSMSWTFGDGGTATGTTPTHAYAVAGTYIVTLTVQDNYGATGSVSYTVAVTAAANQPPTASFSATPSSALVGQYVSFNAAESSDADGGIVSYSWTFGDGSSGSGVSNSHAYSSVGTYTVTLTLQDVGGATGSTSRQIVVQGPSMADLVVQSLTFVPPAPVAGQSITFTVIVANQGAAAAGGFRVRLDGSSLSTTAASSQLVAGATRTLTLVLPLTAASETFTARVDDLSQVAESNEGNNMQSVVVSTRPSGNVVPSATFAWQVLSSSGARLGVEPRTGDRISFDASGSSNPDGRIVSYEWDWESDGSYDTKETSPTIEHTFSTSGSHRVTLRVTDDQGATGSVTQTVDVGERQAPQALFTFSPAQPSVLDEVRFADASTDSDGQVSSWSWEFGDATTSTDRNPSHTYTRKGTFTVKLTVTDNDGLTGTKSQSLTVVNLPPNASFTFDPVQPSTGQSVRFDGSASTDRDGTISSYAWDFDGDGSADATGAVLTRAFMTAGNHVVTLTVTDNDGSTAKRQETITGSTGAPALPRFDNLWAVVIGVGEYIDSHLGDLEGVPTDDAQAVYDFLMDTQGGGFPSDHVRLLVDEAATKNGIEQAWGWLLREAGENDLVLVYFSGHGGHGDDYNGDEPEGDTQDEYLLPYDTDVSDLYSTAVRDDTVGDWVKSLRSEHVVLIFDSCHSGGAARTVKAYESPGVRASPGNTVFTDLMGEEGVLVMAACHATEYAQQDDALGHGIFTYYLLRGLGGADLAESAEADVNDDGRVTVEELRAYVEREVPQYVRDVMGESSPQNPEIIGDEALGSVALSGYGVPLLGEVTALDADRVIISLGTRHGVQAGDRFEVVGVYALPDGTTMRETRATIEVIYVLGPDRSVCRIVEQGFPIEVHDEVRPTS